MRLLRVHEAAEVLGISTSQVYELAKTRSIPSLKVGRNVRIPVDALEEWIRGETRVVDRLAVPEKRRPVGGPHRTPPRGRKATAADGERPGQDDGAEAAPGSVRFLEVADADRPHRRRVAGKVAA